MSDCQYKMRLQLYWRALLLLLLVSFTSSAPFRFDSFHRFIDKIAPSAIPKLQDSFDQSKKYVKEAPQGLDSLIGYIKNVTQQVAPSELSTVTKYIEQPKIMHFLMRYKYLPSTAERTLPSIEEIKQAIRKLQAEAGIEQTGIFDSKTNEILHMDEFLREYKYLPSLLEGAITEDRVEIGSSDYRDIIKQMQRYGGVTETGELDEATRKLMRTPRCGVGDTNPYSAIDEAPGTSEPTTQRPNMLERKDTLTYFLVNAPSGVVRRNVTGELNTAFELWRNSSHLRFRAASSASEADIVISFVRGAHGPSSYDEDFTGPGNAVAHAFLPDPVNLWRQHYGDIHFDAEERWFYKDENLDDSDEYVDDDVTELRLLLVAAHEIGHTLGLGHTEGWEETIMSPYVNKNYLPFEQIKKIKFPPVRTPLDPEITTQSTTIGIATTPQTKPESLKLQTAIPKVSSPKMKSEIGTLPDTTTTQKSTMQEMSPSVRTKMRTVLKKKPSFKLKPVTMKTPVTTTDLEETDETMEPETANFSVPAGVEMRPGTTAIPTALKQKSNSAVPLVNARIPIFLWLLMLLISNTE